MIQGGDPTGTGMGGESIYGDSFEDEFSEELYNIRGALLWPMLVQIPMVIVLYRAKPTLAIL